MSITTASLTHLFWTALPKGVPRVIKLGSNSLLSPPPWSDTRRAPHKGPSTTRLRLDHPMSRELAESVCSPSRHACNKLLSACWFSCCSEPGSAFILEGPFVFSSSFLPRRSEIRNQRRKTMNMGSSVSPAGPNFSIFTARRLELFDVSEPSD